MAYEVRVEKDSVSSAGKRITTFVLKYPRFIHAEFLTHRVFSRNAASNRAIPLKKIIEEVKIDPVIPLKFLKNQPGMQAKEEIERPDLAKDAWLSAKELALEQAWVLGDLGVHKQFVNRLLEPYQWITVVCTSTEYDNWFELRHHEDAQPEIYHLAELMKKEYNKSVPQKLNDGEWHIPFIKDEDIEEAWDITYETDNVLDPSTFSRDLLLKRSVAKCARVSYNNHDGSKTTFEQDLKLFNRLLESRPLHASPAEHQAMAVGDPNIRSGNFSGWIQYRKIIENGTK